MRKIIFLFSVSILCLASCGPKISSDQQKQLNELTASIDSITASVNTLDSAKLDVMITDFSEKKHFVQNEMKDTLSRAMIYRLDSFVQLRKQMSFIKKQYSPIKQEANTMRQQLVDLNHDVENRLVEKKQFDRYFKLEQENQTKLRDAANQLVKISNETLGDYRNQIAFVDSLIDAYDNKINE